MKLLTIIVLIFLVFGGFLIVKYNNYKFDNPDEVVSFTADYGKWLFGVGKSAVKVVGAVIKEDWLPQEAPDAVENASNMTKASKKVVVVYD